MLLTHSDVSKSEGVSSITVDFLESLEDMVGLLNIDLIDPWRLKVSGDGIPGCLMFSLRVVEVDSESLGLKHSTELSVLRNCFL